MLGTNPLEVWRPFFWPLEQDRARLLSWMPTEGWSGPSAFSLSASARRASGTASAYLPALYSRMTLGVERIGTL
jgi:hypothetical protein